MKVKHLLFANLVCQVQLVRLRQIVRCILNNMFFPQIWKLWSTMDQYPEKVDRLDATQTRCTMTQVSNLVATCQLMMWAHKSCLHSCIFVVNLTPLFSSASVISLAYLLIYSGMTWIDGVKPSIATASCTRIQLSFYTRVQFSVSYPVS